MRQPCGCFGHFFSILCANAVAPQTAGEWYFESVTFVFRVYSFFQLSLPPNAELVLSMRFVTRRCWQGFLPTFLANAAEREAGREGGRERGALWGARSVPGTSCVHYLFSRPPPWLRTLAPPLSFGPLVFPPGVCCCLPYPPPNSLCDDCEGTLDRINRGKTLSCAISLFFFGGVKKKK
eukprot:RCo029683